LKRMTHSR